MKTILFLSLLFTTTCVKADERDADPIPMLQTKTRFILRKDLQLRERGTEIQITPAGATLNCRMICKEADHDRTFSKDQAIVLSDMNIDNYYGSIKLIFSGTTNIQYIQCDTAREKTISELKTALKDTFEVVLPILPPATVEKL